MADSPIRRVVVYAGIARIKRQVAWIGLPLFLGLSATSVWSLDEGCSDCMDPTDIAGRAVSARETATAVSTADNTVILNELSSALNNQVIGAEQNVTVVCPGDSIQSAIDTANPVDQLNIIIDGTCTEDITVMRNKVTFEGSANGGELKGTFNVIGARWIRMTNLSVTGPLE